MDQAVIDKDKAVKLLLEAVQEGRVFDAVTYKLAQILLLKAKQDQDAIRCLLPDLSIPDEIVGFHAQQAVEKSIKAVLAHHSIKYRWTHQLDELVDLLSDSGIAYPPDLSKAVALTPYPVELRCDLLPIQDEAPSPLDRQWTKRCVDRIVEWASAVVEAKDA